jgi:hypothetical protein
MRRRSGLKQKHFGMRRRATGLKHLCGKDYMSIGLTLLKMKWTVAAAVVIMVAAGGRAQRGQWLSFDGRGGDAAAVDVFLM